MSLEQEARELTAALVALAEVGISPDVQELLVHGNSSRGIPPGAMRKALDAARQEGARGGEPVDREVVAREAFKVLHPQENWNDFDERYEARGGYHPMQSQCFEIADAVRALASPAEPSGWKAIESAPKDGTAILIWSKYGVVVAARHWDAAFTHWMPLPLPPTSEGGGA